MGLFNKDKMGTKAKKIAQTNAKVAGATLKIVTVRPVTEVEVTHEGLFNSCPSCATVLYAEELQKNLKVCKKCGHHFRLSARERIELTTESFEEFNAGIVGKDPIGFPGYVDKLDVLRESTGESEAIVTGVAKIRGENAVIAVMDSGFMMGSMGAAVGEKFALAVERAIELHLPFVAFTVSGGARMQEGLISLLQMSKTAAVLGKLSQEGIFYLVVLTDPTTGGVTASFAMLGDVTLAEPRATVGFAGRRVIEQTVRTTLPKRFQTAEFLQDKGFVDKIVHREDMPDTIATLLRLHKGVS